MDYFKTMTNIILLSHGNLAMAALQSCEMIVGVKDNFSSLSLTEADTADTFFNLLLDKVHSCPKEEDVIIITDIPGGTPTNCALRLKILYPQITLITGFNLAMLLEAMLNVDILPKNAFLDQLIQSGKESIRPLSLS